MTWLTDNWLWFLLGIGALFWLSRGGHHGHAGLGELGHGGVGGLGHGGQGGQGSSGGPDDPVYGGYRSQQHGEHGGDHGASTGSNPVYGGDAAPDPVSTHADASRMAIDPVTREDVSITTALTSTHEGRIYYFANAANRERFESSPAQFVREAFGAPVGGAPSSAPPPQPRPRRRGGC